MTGPKQQQPTWQLLRALREQVGVTVVNTSGYGPVLITLGSAAEVERVADFYGKQPQRVSYRRVACGVKVGGVQVQFLGDIPEQPERPEAA